MASPVIASQAYTSLGSTTAATIDMTKPTGVTSGDLLVIIMFNDDITATAQWDATYKPTSETWNLVAEVGNATGKVHTAIFWRIADGTEGATTTVTAQSADNIGGWYLRITHADGFDTDPTDGSQTTASDSDLTSHTFTGITTTKDNALIICGAGGDGGDLEPFTTATTNWSTGGSQDSGTGSGAASGWFGYRDLATAGATGSVVVDMTRGTGDAMAAVMVAFVPAASGAVALTGTTFVKAGTFFAGTVTAGAAPGIASVTPSSFRMDVADIDVVGTNFGASQGSGHVYISDASTLAGSANEVQIDAALGTWSDTAISNLDLSDQASLIASLQTLGPGSRYLIVLTNASDEYYWPITLQRPVAFTLSASANITAGGVDTTARLTAPPTKTTGDFTTGRAADDENPLDTVDIATDNYTEVMWSLEATAAALNGETYQFRVLADTVALDTYSLTPNWTISSSLALTGTLFTSTTSFGTGTVAAGDVALTGTTFTKAGTFFAGTVSAGDVSLLGATFTKAPAFGTGTVTAGSVAITGTLFTSTTSFGTGTVTAGSVALTGATFVSTPLFPTGTVSLVNNFSQALIGSTFVSTATFPQAKVAYGIRTANTIFYLNLGGATGGSVTLNVFGDGPVVAYNETNSAFKATLDALDPPNNSYEVTGTAGNWQIECTGYNGGRQFADPSNWTITTNNLIGGTGPTAGVTQQGGEWRIAPVFPQGTIAAGTVAVTGTTFTKAGTFFAGTVSAGDITLLGALFSSAPTFPQGAITPGTATTTGVGHLVLPGTAGNSATEPNDNLYSVTDLEVIVRVGFDDLTPAAQTNIIKASSNATGWYLALEPSGRLLLAGYGDVTANRFLLFSPTPTLESVGARTRHPMWIKGTIDATNGSNSVGTLYYSFENTNDEGAVTWNQLGDPVLDVAEPEIWESDQLTIGSVQGTVQYLYRHIAKNGIGGTVAVDVDWSDLTPAEVAAGSFVEDSVNASTITINGSGWTYVPAPFWSVPSFPQGSVATTYPTTGTLFVSTANFGTGTVAVGAVALTGVLLTSTPSFPQGTVSLGPAPQTLIGTTFVSAPSFNAGTVATSYAITGTLFASVPSFPVGTISTGENSLLGATFVSAPTFGTGAVTAGTVALTGTLFVSTASFGAGVVTATYALTGTTLIGTTSFGTGTITLVGNFAQALTGTTMTSTPTFGTGTVVAASYALTGSLFATTPTFPTGTIAGSYDLTGSTFTSAPTFPTGTVFRVLTVALNGQGKLVFSEDWTGTNGDPWDAAKWDKFGNDTTTIQNNKGQGSAITANVPHQQRAIMPDARDIDMVVRVDRLLQTLHVRFDAFTNTNGYELTDRHGYPDGFVLYRNTAGVQVELARTTSPLIDFTTDHWLRIRVEGINPTRIRVKSWEATQPEPEAWLIDHLDTGTDIETAGKIGLEATLTGHPGNPTTVTWDDLTVQDLSQTSFAVPPTFPTGTVNVGVAPLTGSLFTSAPTFGTGTVSAGDKTLLGATFASAPAFGTGTVSVGAVTLTGTTFVRTTTFGTGAVTATYPVTGTLYVSTASFGTGTVSAGTVAVTGTLFVSTPTFNAGTISLEAIAITGSTFVSVIRTGSNSGSSPSATLPRTLPFPLSGSGGSLVGTVTVGPVALTGNLISSTPSFGTGTVSNGNFSLLGVTFTKAPTFPTGVVTGGAALAGILFASTTSFGTGTVTAGTVAITGSLFTSTPSFGTGNISASGTLLGVTFTKAPTFPTGVVAITTALTGTLHTSITSFGTGTVTSTYPVTGVLFASVAWFGTGTVSSDVNVSLIVTIDLGETITVEPISSVPTPTIILIGETNKAGAGIPIPKINKVPRKILTVGGSSAFTKPIILPTMPEPCENALVVRNTNIIPSFEQQLASFGSGPLGDEIPFWGLPSLDSGVPSWSDASPAPQQTDYMADGSTTNQGPNFRYRLTNLNPDSGTHHARHIHDGTFNIASVGLYLTTVIPCDWHQRSAFGYRTAFVTPGDFITFSVREMASPAWVGGPEMKLHLYLFTENDLDPYGNPQPELWLESPWFQLTDSYATHSYSIVVPTGLTYKNVTLTGPIVSCLAKVQNRTPLQYTDWRPGVFVTHDIDNVSFVVTD